MGRKTDKKPKRQQSAGSRRKEREIRVSKIQSPGQGSGHVAAICLTGHWVEALGFGIGHRIVVRESPGRIELVADWVDGDGILKPKEG